VLGGLHFSVELVATQSSKTAKAVGGSAGVFGNNSEGRIADYRSVANPGNDYSDSAYSSQGISESARVDLVEHAAITEVRLLHFCPAAEIGDGHEGKFRKLAVVFRGYLRIARTVIVFRHDLLSFL